MINLKFVGRSFYGIKKFLTPYKWETIWTGKVIARSNLYGELRKVAIVQYDRYKDRYSAYVTNGIDKEDIDINFLTSEFPELKTVLTRYGIKI